MIFMGDKCNKKKSKAQSNENVRITRLAKKKDNMAVFVELEDAVADLGVFFIIQVYNFI